MEDLKQLIREVPDYPKPGILFYDLTTLLKDKKGFRSLIDRLCAHYEGHKIDLVAGIEARGFIFAPALALGSFLNVIASRLPLGQSVARPGSRLRSTARRARMTDGTGCLGSVLAAAARPTAGLVSRAFWFRGDGHHPPR